MSISSFALRKRRTFALSAFALAAALATPAQATDGYFQNGTGAKAKGAGGVGIALAQDALAIGTNPAAATDLDHRLDVGVDIFVPDRGATISGNGAGLNGDYSGNGANPFILGDFGYVRPLSDSVSVGIAIHGNGGMNTEYEQNPFASFGATGPAGVDLKQAFVVPTVAAKVAPGHSLGVSGIVVIQGFRASGIAPFSVASMDPANFTDKGTDWALGGGFRVGYLGHLNDTVSVGAFYQSKVWAGKFDKYAGLFAEQGGFDVPASWGAGIAVKATDRLTLATDVKRIEYSGVQSVGNPIDALFGGTPFGADNGPGFGWKDITVVKAGVVYDASESWTLRAGYGYSENPIPNSQTFLNILAPGALHHHMTVGATYTLPSGLELTGYAMHAARNTVPGENSIPVNYGGGEADIRLAETSLGLSVGVTF